MDIKLAKKILQLAEEEMAQHNAISFGTVKKIREAVHPTGKDYVTFFYPEGHVIKFNSARWKRLFMEE